MDQPNVSVIMTVYNGEKYVEQAINSITRQTLSNFEFVIVDDGSTDCSPEILARAAAQDPRIKVIKGQRIGRAKALNLAWKSSTAPFVANIDADDMAEPERLEKQRAFLMQHPEVGLLGTACRRIWESEDGKGIKREVITHPLLTDPELKSYLVRHNPYVHSSVMMPRHVLEEVGGYNEALKVSLDYDLWARIAYHYALAQLPEPLSVYRIHQTNFFMKISEMERYKTVVKIRLGLWRALRRPLHELFYVINPLRFVRVLYVQIFGERKRKPAAQ